MSDDTDTRGVTTDAETPGPAVTRRPAPVGFVAPNLTIAVGTAWFLWELPRLAHHPSRLVDVAVFVFAATLTITIHEAGHYETALLFGLDPYMRVGPLFGYTALHDDVDPDDVLSPQHRIVFAGAGPIANLATYSALTHGPIAEVLHSATAGTVWAHVASTCARLALLVGLFNLMPVSMLDGGRIVAATLELCPPGWRRPGVYALRAFGLQTLLTLTVLIAGADRTLWIKGPQLTLVLIGALASLTIGRLPDRRPPDAIDLTAILLAAVCGVAAGWMIWHHLA